MPAIVNGGFSFGSLSTNPTHYIKYVMGPTISTCNHVRMKGTEVLRNQYAACELSIRPKTKISKIDQLKLIIEALGLNPNEILSRDNADDASGYRRLDRAGENGDLEQSLEASQKNGMNYNVGMVARELPFPGCNFYRNIPFLVKCLV